MDTNNNNPMDPGQGSTPPTSDANTDTSFVPTPTPDMGIGSVPTSAPVADDAPIAPVSAPLPDMGTPVPQAETPAPTDVPSNESGIHDSGTGFDPAMPTADVLGGDSQYKSEVAPASADFHSGMGSIEKKYDATENAASPEAVSGSVPTANTLDVSAPAEVPTPATETPTDTQS